MGPAVKDEETLRGLIRGGMDVARFNFSHGTHEEQKDVWICSKRSVQKRKFR